MTLPLVLVLGRHGFSEGNLVVEASKRGDQDLYTDAFRSTPGRRWRLLAEGAEHARATGEFLRSGEWRPASWRPRRGIVGRRLPGSHFDRYYVSPYTRAIETAGLYDLPGAHWRIEQRLRERDWGDVSMIPRSEFAESFPHNHLIKQIDSGYWRAPGGESIADVRLRVRDVFDTMHRETSNGAVLIVSHESFMASVRAELQRMGDEEWEAWDADPVNKAENGSLDIYSRIDPEVRPSSLGTAFRRSRGISHRVGWVRHVAPSFGIDSGWTELPRRTYSNAELLDLAHSVEPMFLSAESMEIVPAPVTRLVTPSR